MISIFIPHLDKIYTAGFLILFSLYLRILLQLFGLSWIRTVSHTATLTLLPMITYIITSVISGNIALSLGMVGALSIVRFRNPVRSPLELSVYFGAITMGIAASVSFNWLLFLVATVTAIGLVLWLANLVSIILFKQPFYSSSFTEGNSLSTLVTVSNKKINGLHESIYLTSINISHDTYEYLLQSINFDTLKDMCDELDGDERIISMSISK